MANRHIAERYATALASFDLTSLKHLVHPDIVVRYPQSGETFRGIDSYLATIEEYPGLPGMGEMVSSGSSARESVIVSQTSPFTPPILTVIGDGETFVGEFVAAYPNGDLYHVVSIVRIREGLVISDTAYFGLPFDPPDWRKKYQAG